MCGKGDTYRPVDGPEYRKNYDRIFGFKGFKIGDTVRLKHSPDDYRCMPVVGFEGGKILVNVVDHVVKDFFAEELEKTWE